MAEALHREAVRELERGLGPFTDPQWREDLALMGRSVRIGAILLAQDSENLVGLARQVPRSPGDERGGTPWTSFLREIAVVKKISDRAAAADVDFAHALLQRHPRTFELLLHGKVPAHRARLLVEECAGHIDAVAAAAEAALADRLGDLPPWRIRQEVTLLALRLDAEARAQQEAQPGAHRTAGKTSLPHAQAEVVLTGPAAVVQRWWEALTDQARALKAAGDPRSLGQLRFDLAMQADPRALTGLDPLMAAVTGTDPVDAPAPAAGLGVPLVSDARCSRPVQAAITVPAATSLGLSDEPGWLEGYGWISAPLSRRLLTVAELREACVAPDTGQLLDLADRIERPPPEPGSLREAIQQMVLQPHELRHAVTDSQNHHDPSPRLSAFVAGRDRSCDGPTGTNSPAARCDQDHDLPWPNGPTAAWNLASRAPRTHQLKHLGWRPVRDARGTTWTSPAGQTSHTPHFHHPPPQLDGRPLPDPQELAQDDLTLTRARFQPHSWEPDDDQPPTSSEADDREAPRTGATRHGWSDEPPF